MLYRDLIVEFEHVVRFPHNAMLAVWNNHNEEDTYKGIDVYECTLGNNDDFNHPYYMYARFALDDNVEFNKLLNYRYCTENKDYHAMLTNTDHCICGIGTDRDKLYINRTRIMSYDRYLQSDGKYRNNGNIIIPDNSGFYTRVYYSINGIDSFHDIGGMDLYHAISKTIEFVSLNVTDYLDDVVIASRVHGRNGS